MTNKSQNNEIQTMPIYLANETWVDIFQCFRRRELAEWVVSIGNERFCTLANFYLHESGKRTLREIWFSSSGIFDGKRNVLMPLDSLPFPQDVSLPKNIETFKCISLFSDLHFHRLNEFLDKIQHLLVDVNLMIDTNPFWISILLWEQLMRRLNNRIDSICFYPSQLTKFSAHFSSALNAAKFIGFTPISMHAETKFQSEIFALYQWLAKGNSSEPKMLIVRYNQYCCQSWLTFMAEFISFIKKKFSDCQLPATFLVEFRFWPTNVVLDKFCIHNANTNAELCYYKNAESSVFLRCHLINIDRHWLMEKEKKIVHWKPNTTRSIVVHSSKGF